jgi:hypothetical protein
MNRPGTSTEILADYLSFAVAWALAAQQVIETDSPACIAFC